MRNRKYIEYKDANLVLLKSFPQLLNDYEVLRRRFSLINESVGPHVLYGDIFCDFISSALKERNEKLLRDAGEFIESLLKLGDAEIVNLIELSVLETLIDSGESDVSKYFGNKTKLSISAMSNKMDFEVNLWM